VALFAIGYLPIGKADLYVKAGAAYLDSYLQIVPAYICTIVVPDCYVGPFDESDHNIGFAAGIGGQFSIGSVSVRGEYEGYKVAGESPSLFSVAIAWNF
jgi:opacity protein-like surface antigen